MFCYIINYLPTYLSRPHGPYGCSTHSPIHCSPWRLLKIVQSSVTSPTTYLPISSGPMVHKAAVFILQFTVLHEDFLRSCNVLLHYQLPTYLSFQAPWSIRLQYSLSSSLYLCNNTDFISVSNINSKLVLNVCIFEIHMFELHKIPSTPT